MTVSIRTTKNQFEILLENHKKHNPQEKEECDFCSMELGLVEEGLISK